MIEGYINPESVKISTGIIIIIVALIGLVMFLFWSNINKKKVHERHKRIPVPSPKKTSQTITKVSNEKKVEPAKDIPEKKSVVKKDRKSVKKVSVSKKNAELKSNKNNKSYSEKQLLLPGVEERKQIVELKNKEIKMDKKRKTTITRKTAKIDLKQEASNPNQYFYMSNSVSLKSLFDLEQYLKEMSDEVFNSHVSGEKNDFANWVEGVFKFKNVAAEIRTCKTKNSLKSLLKKYN